MTIFTDKQKANFNSMRWQDAFSWIPIELLSTELQWSNYLKYSELKGWLTFFLSLIEFMECSQMLCPFADKRPDYFLVLWSPSLRNMWWAQIS